MFKFKLILFLAIIANNFLQFDTLKCDMEFLSSREKNGVFSSPNFPDPYPNNTHCVYKFMGKSHERVVIRFESFNFYDDQKSEEYSRADSCSGMDTFISYTASFQNGRNQQAYICRQPPQFLFSVINIFKLEFVGKLSNENSTGFNATYEFVESFCDEIFRSTKSKNGTFSSPMYPYPHPNGSRCTYDFRGSSDENVQIIFEDFELYQSNNENYDRGTTCNINDSMLVYEKGGFNITYCGKRNPLPILSNTNELTLKFYGEFAGESKGFKATYRFTKDYGIDAEKADKSLSCGFKYSSGDSQEGVFYSPNYPGFYPRNIKCFYFFYGEIDEVLDLQFEVFNLLGDNTCEDGKSDIVGFSDKFESLTTDKQCGIQEPFTKRLNGSFFIVSFLIDKESLNETALQNADHIGFFAKYRFTNISEIHDDNSSNSIFLDKLMVTVTIILFIWQQL